MQHGYIDTPAVELLFFRMRLAPRDFCRHMYFCRSYGDKFIKAFDDLGAETMENLHDLGAIDGSKEMLEMALRQAGGAV